jgi:glycerophosphoryl diester phosphodiesterase
VAAAHDADLAVNVWTVNRLRQLATMIELGVDGLITDDPAGALALVGRPPEGRTTLA